MANNLKIKEFDDLELELQKLVSKAELYLEKFGEIKNWEIFGGIENSSNIKIVKSFLKRSSSHQSIAITVRVFGKEGNIGSSCITRLSEPHIKSAIGRAVKIMRVSPPNPEFIGLAKPPKKYPNVNTNWDSEISELEIEDSAEIIDKFLEQKKRDTRIKAITGRFGYGDSRIVLHNSNGIRIKDKGTTVSAFIEFIMEETVKGNIENSNGYDWQSYNSLKSMKLQKIFDSAYKMGLKGLKKTKIETGSYPVILSPLAVDLLICSGITSGINAELIHQKRSFLQNKINSKIGNDLLEIIDDPHLKDGFDTSPFDAEGTPTKPLKIVENGILQSYLHNVYTSNLFKTNNTGHASRSWYSASIGIESSNIIMKNGDNNLETMLSDIKNGIFLDYSSDSPNIVTGEFSGLINGYLITDGEMGQSVRETMLGTNLMDLYNKIEKISKETIRKGSSYLPYVLISNLTISGAK